MSEAFEGRLALVRQKMRETGADLVVLGPGAHMQWLAGFHPHPDERPSMLFVGGKEEAFLMPALNAESSREHTNVRFFTWSDADGPHEALKAALIHLGVSSAGNVALDETMRSDFALLVLDTVPSAKHRFTEDTVGLLRMCKDAGEYELLKANARIADQAMEAAVAALRPGLTELELAQVAKEEFLSNGAAPEFAIIGAGPNGAFPHHSTGEREIREGEALVIDIGARSSGYVSDITRMAVIGDAAEGYHEIHAAVDAAVRAALDAARPGARAKEVDDAARRVIADAGYGEYFVHRTGHGLGIEVHEPPYITATSETVLEQGMVHSIEPGVYLPGRFGVRLEEIVFLTHDGPEILSELPRDLRVV